ncbi:hypothetical protein HN510_01855, partial [Candidatus Woesearchaeota archaeon]|nr:hypothetical protein [Candidatus Woesearchaeota archaeon]
NIKSGSEQAIVVTGDNNNIINNVLTARQDTVTIYSRSNSANNNQIESNTIIATSTSAIFLQSNADSNTFTLNDIYVENAQAIRIGTCINNAFYNNNIEASSTSNVMSLYDLDAVNIWNIEPEAGSPIIGTGVQIGGNYWTTHDGNGYSDTCTDLDNNAFCDAPFKVYQYSEYYDNYPLSNEPYVIEECTSTCNPADYPMCSEDNTAVLDCILENDCYSETIISDCTASSCVDASCIAVDECVDECVPEEYPVCNGNTLKSCGMLEGDCYSIIDEPCFNGCDAGVCLEPSCPSSIDIEFNKNIFYSEDLFVFNVWVYDNNNETIPNKEFKAYNHNTQNVVDFKTNDDGVFTFSTVLGDITEDKVVDYSVFIDECDVHDTESIVQKVEKITCTDECDFSEYPICKGDSTASLTCGLQIDGCYDEFESNCEAGCDSRNGLCTIVRDGCIVHTDCSDGYVCVNSLCYAEQCTIETDCPIGYVCAQGTCEPGIALESSCGDGNCDADESCSTCSTDCGTCSNNGGGSSGGSSGGTPFISTPTNGSCQPNVTCTEWTTCDDGFQTRSCEDENNCTEDSAYTSKRECAADGTFGAELDDSGKFDAFNLPIDKDNRLIWFSGLGISFVAFLLYYFKIYRPNQTY